MALGYMALIILWNRRSSRHVEHFRSVGRIRELKRLAAELGATEGDRYRPFWS